MEFYLWFPLYFFLAIIVIRSKKIEIGEFIVIRWNEQPVLFAGVVVVLTRISRSKAPAIRNLSALNVTPALRVSLQPMTSTIRSFCRPI